MSSRQVPPACTGPGRPAHCPGSSAAAAVPSGKKRGWGRLGRGWEGWGRGVGSEGWGRGWEGWGRGRGVKDDGPRSESSRPPLPPRSHHYQSPTPPPARARKPPLLERVVCPGPTPLAHGIPHHTISPSPRPPTTSPARPGCARPPTTHAPLSHRPPSPSPSCLRRAGAPAPAAGP